MKVINYKYNLYEPDVHQIHQEAAQSSFLRSLLIMNIGYAPQISD
jgi:hypothetical protein